MAKGRFISRSVGHSREIAALPDDTARMIFAFILPYIDAEGRADADPVYLTGICLSRLRIPPEKVARSLVAMYEVGLIELYEEFGVPFLQYVNFEKHQQGLRKEREDASTLPPPTGRFPTQFEPYLRSALYQLEPKNTDRVGHAAAELPPALESPARDSESNFQVPRSDSADLGETLESSAQSSEGNSEVPRGDSEAPDEVGGISLSLSLSSKEPIGSLERDGELEKSPTLEPKTSSSSSPSEERFKNFSLIKTKLGLRRKTSLDEEDIDLVTECLAEDDSRDLWFDLPHTRVQEAIRDSTAAFKKGGQFKTEFISELDKATRTLRASVSPRSDAFDSLVQEWERETGDTYKS